MRENKKYTLVGVDGNAYYVMGFVVKCMRQEHKTLEEISEYYTEARKGDYYNLLIKVVARNPVVLTTWMNCHLPH